MHSTHTRRLTNETAKKMMTTALAIADTAGVSVSIAIVDAGGYLIMMERMEGDVFGSVKSAISKAVSAASSGSSDSGVLTPGRPADDQVMFETSFKRSSDNKGGYSIFKDGDCVGGIGVAGSESNINELIASGAIKAIGSQ